MWQCHDLTWQSVGVLGSHNPPGGGGARDDPRDKDKVAPAEAHYEHNARWGDGNGFSHLRSALLKTERALAWLEGLDRQYLYGRNTWWRAVIAAKQGERDRAVALLQEAFSQGEWIARYELTGWYEPLRGYPPFEELLRPKG